MDTAKPKFNRIERLKKQYEQYVPTLNLDLAMVKTQVMAETDGEPMCIRRAKAFTEYCRTKTIFIQDDELIVGNVGSAPRQAVVTPEVSANWISEELETMSTRMYDPIQVSEDDKKRFKEVIEPYWKGKTVLDQWLARIPEDIKDIGYKSGIIDAEVKTQTGPGEICLGYENIIMPHGYGGVKKKAQARYDTLEITNIEDIPKSEFLKSVMIVCDGMEILANRHAEEAERMAGCEKDDVRKKELLKVAEVCRWVSTKPPRSLWEALQLIWFSQFALDIELNAPSYSLGRFDQYMYPVYEADIENGIATKEQEQELLECMWIKMAEQIWYLSEEGSKYYAGYTKFQNTNVGGIIPETGEDAVNDMSYMVMKASMDVRLCQPSISVRLNEKNSDEFIRAVAEFSAIGTGYPAVHNDKIGIKNLLRKGVTEEEAKNWCLIGCVEPAVPGSLHQWSASTAWNFGAAVEFALTNGVHRMTGEKYGLETGDVNKMKTFDEFYEAFKKQVAYFIKVSSVFSNITEIAQMERCPTPLASLLIEDCLENATDIMAGGARYTRGPGTLGIGIGDAVDSLAAVKKLVFEEKKVTFEELNAALDADFKGHERIQQMLINRAPKYGNDDDYADHFAVEIADFVCDEHEKYKTMFSTLMPSLYPVSSNIPQGQSISALPSGRKAGIALADGCSPCHGVDIEGPTAAMNSVAKIHGDRVDGGYLLNLKFDPATIRSEEGIERFVGFLKAFRESDLYEVQFNVVGKETLEEAREHPEDYRSLLVRVAGYSAYFVELSKPLQDDIVDRTTHRLAS